MNLRINLERKKNSNTRFYNMRILILRAKIAILN